MIIVPVWVEKEEPNGFLVVLGSEPSFDAVPEWIPTELVENCIYSDLTASVEGRRMAILVFEESKAPEKIKKLLGKQP